MSSLWKDKMIKNLLIFFMRPSPKHNEHIPDLAQGQPSHLDVKFPVYTRIQSSIERISLFISSFTKIRGSMTVEAAVVLPLFLFFFLNLGCAMEMIRLHGNLELALSQVGNSLAIYGAAMDLEETNEEKVKEEGLLTEMAGIAFSYTYVKSEILEYLGKEYLENSPLKNGTDSLQFLESNINEVEDTFEIIVSYSVAPFSEVTGFQTFRMANRYYGHIWNGYEIKIPDENELHVYLTENGIVYHKTNSCTHLKLSIKQVTLQEAIESRNQQGEKYNSCERCCENALPKDLYITEDGDCYHTKQDCPGLKRTIYYVPVTQAIGYKACARCGG